jgi:hypothetical protein
MSTETISADLPVTIDDLPAERQRWAAAAMGAPKLLANPVFTCFLRTPSRMPDF